MFFAIDEGYIEEDEDLKGYFYMPDKMDSEGIIGQHPLYCCPFCGGDFKHNGRKEKFNLFERIKKCLK
jgi:hypothetical protein